MLHKFCLALRLVLSIASYLYTTESAQLALDVDVGGKHEQIEYNIATRYAHTDIRRTQCPKMHRACEIAPATAAAAADYMATTFIISTSQSVC